MSIIKITNFGGELPRVSPRALPADAAQVNSNLLATSTEFRPLLGDTVVGVAPNGAKTLYRLARNSSGVLRTDDTSGWIAEVDDKSYVKGQINDDGSERTYVSFNDGSAPPRSIDALGKNKLLGVPPPATLTATLNVAPRFTRAEGTDWITQRLVPDITGAMLETLVDSASSSRMKVGGTPVAGPYTVQGLSWINTGDTDYWNLRYVLPLATATAAGLVDPLITPEASGANLVIRITCLPYWAYVANGEPFKVKLRGIRSPVDAAAQLMDEALVTALSDALVERFDPAGVSLRSMRDALDATVAEFKRSLAFALTDPGSAPVPPTKPAGPEYEWVLVQAGDSSGNQQYLRTAEWLAYDGLLAAYQINLAAYRAAGGLEEKEKAARVTKIAELQATAKRLTQQLEAANAERRADLDEWVREFVDGRDFDFGEATTGTANVVPIDADPILDDRFYFATYTTTDGEESAPSPVSGMLSVDQDSSVTLTVPTPPSNYGINKWTVYRTANGSASSAFQFVAEKLVASGLTYVDLKKTAELGEVCPTLTWAMPPFRIDTATSTATNLVPKGPNPYLRGLVSMPNGIMAGYIDNFVAFCDPYHPYAWPVEYQIPLDSLIVGLGVFGQTLFVGTTSNPYLISGADSASMSAQRMDDAQACASHRSIVSAGGGVLYASPDGICLASTSGVQVITTTLFAREDWQKLNPASILAIMHDGVYYFWYTGNGGGCYALDITARKLTRLDIAATAVFSDTLTDAVFYTSGTQVKRAFSAGRRDGAWKSPRIELDAPRPMAWAKVMGDQTIAVPVTFTWTADGAVRYTRTVTDTQPWRLPPGLYDEHEITVSSKARITKIVLAGSTEELKSVQ